MSCFSCIFIIFVTAVIQISPAELRKGGVLAEDAAVLLVPVQLLPDKAVVDVVVHQFARHLGALL